MPDFTINVSEADPNGRRSCVATGPDGEHRDYFNPDDAFRREKFLREAARVACEPEDDPATRRAVSIYFWSVVRAKDGPAEGAVGREADAPLRAVVRRASTVEPRPAEWLWPGRLPTGALAIVAGDPGLSKSTLALDVAARATRGARWPDGRPGGEPGAVMVLSAEDDAATTIVPRLLAHGADLERVTLVEGVGRTALASEASPDSPPPRGEGLGEGVKRAPGAPPPPEGGGGTRPAPLAEEAIPAPRVERSVSLASDLALLREALDERDDWRLIVVDPISAYTPGVDTHRNADVRSLLAPLSQVAADRRLTVLAVTHLNKSSSGPAVYRAMGSLAFVAAARVALLVARDPDDADRRLLLPIKNNLAPDRDGLAYTIEESRAEGAEGVGRLAWDPEPVRMTADELAATSREPGDGDRAGGREGSCRPASRVAEAEAWLAESLADGPRASRELIAEANAGEGFSERTVRKAARRLGVDSVRPTREGEPYRWRLAESPAPLVPLDPLPEEGQPGQPGQAEKRGPCVHEWTESPSAWDGYVRVTCGKCGESLGDVPAAA